MKILHGRIGRAGHLARRGAALLLSLLLLLILVAIVIQINVSTGTDARVARNDVTMTTMDLAAESALLQVLETLKADGEADAGTAGAPSSSNPTGGLPTGGTDAAAGAPGESQQPCDSRRDEWATPQRTEINGIRLRIVIQDENSKFNILNMLNPDEKEAEAATEVVVRILDACREGTNYDIDQRTAEEMAKAWIDALTKRKTTKLPRAKLLTDDEKDDDRTMPMSIREVMPLEPFEDHHFKDFRDEEGRVVHSIGSFLTVWSSLQTTPNATGTAGGGATSGGAGGTGTNTGAASGGTSSGSTASKSGSSSSGSSSSGSTASGKSDTGSSGSTGASGSSTAGGGTNGAGSTAGGGTSGAGGGARASTSFGYGVNVNTAPTAVLKSLVDSRIVSGRFWDEVVEYRNLEDEEEKKKDEEARASDSSLPEEEQLDEYGQPILKRRIFETLQELSEVDGYADLTSENQAKLQQLLGTQSEVFSIYIIARKATTADASADLGMTPAEQRKREETGGDSLTRVLHAVYWRQSGGEETTLVPILRWEVVDYVPYEVLDYPPDDR